MAALKTIFFLWGSTLLGALLVFITQVLLARSLGAEQFGIFSSALTVMGLFIPLAGLGVSQVWLKLYGSEGYRAQRWLPPSYLLMVLSGSFSLLLIIIWAFYGPHGALFQTVFLLLVLHLFGQLVVELVSSYFQLEENYQGLALVQFLPHLARFLLLAIVVFLGGGAYGQHAAHTLLESGVSVVSVAYAYAFVAFWVVVLCSRILFRMYRKGIALAGHPRDMDKTESSEADEATLGELFHASWPFGMGAVCYLIYFQSAVAVISYLASPHQAGIYNVALVILTAVYLFPNVVYQKYLLPKIHRWSSHDVAALEDCYRQGNRILLLLGLAAMTTVWLCGFWSIPLLFGPDYSGAVGILNLLALAIPIRFVATSVGAMLVTGGNMRRKVRYMAWVAVINLVLMGGLIPVMGLKGAALAAVLSDIALLLLYYRAVRHHVFPSFTAV